jgi:SH3-like domain-containing protein
MDLLRDLRRLAAGILVGTIATVCGIAAAHAAGEMGTGPSGLPYPRFVSLKADKVNMHVGPAKTYDVSWVYTRAGLPVEITVEFENWRRIRDSDGVEGWVYHSLLSGRRMGLVKPKAKDELVDIRDKADANAGVVAQLQAGVLGTVKKCSGAWCRISGDGFDGWIEQDRLWGVYPNEKIE